MPRPAPLLFVDDGGVMNDNRLRGPQWAALLGQFLSNRYGGASAEWTDANLSVFQPVWNAVSSRRQSFATHRDFHREYSLAWSRAMFSAVGRPSPPPDECVRLVEESSIHVLERIRADFPGVVGAVRALHAAGFILNTASGTTSSELDAIPRGMGVRDCFDGLYGPDLVNIPKNGPGYYRRIFEDAGIDPRLALVIGSDEDECAWAESVGARAVRVGEDAPVRGFTELADTLLSAAP